MACIYATMLMHDDHDQGFIKFVTPGVLYQLSASRVPKNLHHHPPHGPRDVLAAELATAVVPGHLQADPPLRHQPRGEALVGEQGQHHQRVAEQQPVRQAVNDRGLFTAGWFGVREK